MSNMRRSIVCCLAIALPVLAAAEDRNSGTGQSATGTESEASEVCAVQGPMLANGEYQWRLHAFQQLDCVIDVLDKALGARSGEAVTLSRADAEHLRLLALGARDSVGRIAR